MSNPDEDVLKRFLSDEPLDGAAGEEFRQALLRRFERARKKLVIHATAWIAVGIVLVFAGVYGLLSSVSTRSMLLATAILLIGYESTVLIKLWYWTVDSKLAMLKEIKRLQILAAGGALPEDGSEKGGAADEGVASTLDRVSMRRLGWIVGAGLAVVGGICGVVFLAPLHHAHPGREILYRSEYDARASADGSLLVTGRMTHTYVGIRPLQTILMLSPGELHDVVWRDAQGSVLDHEVEEQPDGYLYRVRLAHTVYREEDVDLRVTWAARGALRNEDGVWTFLAPAPWRDGIWPRHDLTWYPGGYGDGRSVQSFLTLPERTAPESISHQPFMQWTEDGRTVLYYREPQKIAEEQEIRVTYRLPEGAERPSS